jgi:hypothetical protein
LLVGCSKFLRRGAIASRGLFYGFAGSTTIDSFCLLPFSVVSILGTNLFVLGDSSGIKVVVTMLSGEKGLITELNVLSSSLCSCY